MAVDVEGDHRRAMPKTLLDRFHGLSTLDEQAGVEMSEQVIAVTFGDAERFRRLPLHIGEGGPWNWPTVWSAEYQALRAEVVPGYVGRQSFYDEVGQGNTARSVALVFDWTKHGCPRSNSQELTVDLHRFAYPVDPVVR
jgi:hypothetical protein